MANGTAQGEPLIRVESLRKSFGSHLVLKDIDLSVNQGEVVTIIGASGSGKSTLLRCMNLLETPDSGHIWFHGEDLSGHIWFHGEDLAADRVNINRLREHIGMVFQSFNLFNNMNVLDNCTLAPITLKKMSKAQAEDEAKRNLIAVGLADFINAPSTSLSGGQKQRVAIARALCMKPDLMLFDLTDGSRHLLSEANSPKATDSYHSWSSNSRWLVFSSRRMDGLYTRPFFTYIDEQGNAHKPFVLPQDNPAKRYDGFFFSYNIPEFIRGKVEVRQQDIASMMKGSKGVDVSYSNGK